jgi:geranylgeranyl diphosphate synthase type I
MYGGAFPEEAIAAGAAMELFQSAFLIHDDIMDRDETRRGKPAIHSQYAALAREGSLQDSTHIGEALGICAGDMALFIAFDILSGLAIEGGAKSRLLSRFCRELEYVGLAQMADVYQGASDSGVSPENILGLYRYKTGRYTFSLPFAAGLILAGQEEKLVDRFVLLGEKMGVLFQIKDDELGLWANEKELGKPVGSDIAENKKTLYRQILFDRAGAAVKKKLEGIFGSPAPSPQDIAFVLEQMEAFNVRAGAAETASAFYREAETLIAGLPPGNNALWIRRLRDLLDYNMRRGS